MKQKNRLQGEGTVDFSSDQLCDARCKLCGSRSPLNCDNIRNCSTPIACIEPDTSNLPQQDTCDYEDSFKIWEGTCESLGPSRCAVCGLTDSEGHALDNLFLVSSEDSPVAMGGKYGPSEGMGALFTCDGNCGNYFHPRCVGLPSSEIAEWYCIDCSNVQRDLSEAQSDGFGPEISEAPSSVLSKITKQYHVMRLERNRLLLNWQQERKLTRLKAEKDLESQLLRDRDHDAMVEKCHHLEKELLRSQAETERVRKCLDQEFNLRVILERDTKEHRKVPISLLSHSTSEQSKTLLPLRKESSGQGKRDDEARNSPSGSPTSILKSSSHKSFNEVDRKLTHSHHSKSQGIPKPWRSRHKQVEVSEFANDAISDLQQNSIDLSSTDRESQVEKTINRSVPSLNSNSPDGEKRRLQVSPIRNAAGHGESSCGSSPLHTDSVGIQKTKDTFLFPMRNRLKDLLKSVEIEAGSFADIRSKQKERELMRTSQSSRRSSSKFSASVDLGEIRKKNNNREGNHSYNTDDDDGSFNRTDGCSQRLLNDDPRKAIKRTLLRVNSDGIQDIVSQEKEYLAGDSKITGNILPSIVLNNGNNAMY